MTVATLRRLAALTRALRDAILREMRPPHRDPNWWRLRQAYQAATGRCDDAEFADAVAQSVACVQFSRRASSGRVLPPRAVDWLMEQSEPLVKRIWSLCLAPPDRPASDESARAAAAIAKFLDPQTVSAVQTLCRKALPGEDELIHFFEKFLHVYDPDARRRQGVFYTPAPVVSFVVRSVDQLLRDEFRLRDGLADDSTTRQVLQPAGMTARRLDPSRPFVRVLDPAMGTGAFLVEVVRQIHRRFQSRFRDATPRTDMPDRWDAYVAQSMLSRIFGQELMLPALLLGQLAMARALNETGYRFASGARLRLHLANTMMQPEIAADDDAQPAFTIVVGNPPFSGVSDNRCRWIEQLLRGRSPRDDAPVANYFLVQGQPLGEKKHWLEDDYVKFMRFAHWQIESAGAGIVALVTNHGFLDNSTFRGMREQLLAAFPRVTIVDLHGNQRNGERPPAGTRNESVFSIGQGVAVSLLRRPPDRDTPVSVAYSELWGTRQQKLDQLAIAADRGLAAKSLEPAAPCFYLVPHDSARRAEYERGFPLTDVMPVNSTAAVTARDGFVVAFDDAELQARLSEFCDERISDDAIRSRFFTTTRSSKYPAGDTRGWRLTEARQRMRRLADRADRIRGCFYRPFDRRRVFWTNWMIDWPRESVMNHLVDGGNLALIARRQTPPSQPCCYFWITDTLALDGLVRSDNRGSESVFPVFLREGSAKTPDLFAPRHKPSDVAAQPEQRANFAPRFIDALAARLKLHWRDNADANLADGFTPTEVCHYIYALFHSPGYRQRYAAWLVREFPRVLIPREATLFRRLAGVGCKLAALHLRRVHAPNAEHYPAPARDVAIKPGFPKFAAGRIWLDEHTASRPVPAEVWNFRVGTYQVCRKWLKDRLGRVLTAQDVVEYGQIVAAVTSTVQCMQLIDEMIEQHGSWSHAFA